MRRFVDRLLPCCGRVRDLALDQVPAMTAVDSITGVLRLLGRCLHARACDPVPGLQLAQLRHLRPAAFDRQRAAGMKHAAARRIDRTRHFTFHDAVSTPPFHIGIGNRHRFEQRLGVGMQRVGEQFVGFGKLHQPPEIHDGHAVA